MNRRPLGVASVARLSLRVYRQQAGFLLPLALLLFVPLGLLDALADQLGHIEGDGTIEGIAGFLVGLLVVVPSDAIGEQFYAGAVLLAVAESMSGTPRPPLGRLLRMIPYLTLIGVDILFSVGLGVGLVLLVVPGVAFFGYFVLAAPLVKIERLGVRSAFARSRELARGHLRFIVVFLGGVYLGTDLLTEALQEGGPLTLGDSLLTDWAIAVAVGVLITPIWAVALDVVALLLVEEASRSPRPAAAPPPAPR